MAVGTTYSEESGQKSSVEKWQKIINKIKPELKVMNVERTENYKLKKHVVEYGLFVKKYAEKTKAVFDYRISFDNNTFIIIPEDLEESDILQLIKSENRSL